MAILEELQYRIKTRQLQKVSKEGRSRYVHRIMTDVKYGDIAPRPAAAAAGRDPGAASASRAGRGQHGEGRAGPPAETFRDLLGEIDVGSAKEGCFESFRGLTAESQSGAVEELCRKAHGGYFSKARMPTEEERASALLR